MLFLHPPSERSETARQI